MEEYNEFESQYTFDETFQRLKSKIFDLNLKIFAIFDHSKNAQEVGMAMQREIVVVFGNPSIGTLIMRDDMRAGIDLPSKVILFERSGSVFVGIKKYRRDLKSNEAIEAARKLNDVVESIAKASTGK